jgi:hypothetical protein
MVIEVLTMSFTVELHTKLRRCPKLHGSFFSARDTRRHQSRRYLRGHSYAFRLTRERNGSMKSLVSGHVELR